MGSGGICSWMVMRQRVGSWLKPNSVNSTIKFILDSKWFGVLLRLLHPHRL